MFYKASLLMFPDIVESKKTAGWLADGFYFSHLF